LGKVLFGAALVVFLYTPASKLFFPVSYKRNLLTPFPM